MYDGLERIWGLSLLSFNCSLVYAIVDVCGKGTADLLAYVIGGESERLDGGV